MKRRRRGAWPGERGRGADRRGGARGGGEGRRGLALPRSFSGARAVGTVARRSDFFSFNSTLYDFSVVLHLFTSFCPQMMDVKSVLCSYCGFHECAARIVISDVHGASVMKPRWDGARQALQSRQELWDRLVQEDGIFNLKGNILNHFQYCDIMCMSC